MRRNVLFLCSFLLLTGCAGPASPASPDATPTVFPIPTTQPTPAVSITPETTPTAVPPTPTPAMSTRPHYELQLTLDYAGHSAGVHELITYPNRSGAALDTLVLAVEPGLWPGAFKLGSLTLDGQAVSPGLSGERLTVILPQPLPDGGSVSLALDYGLRIPQQGDRYLFGYNASQTNLLDWYPFVVPYSSGKGWLLHAPAPVGEHLAYESADFDVALRFSGQTPALSVAASAPGLSDGEWTRYRLQGARGFALSVSDRFLTTSADAGGVPVTSYYFEGHQAAGQAAAQAAAAALRFFAGKFAPYPYQSLSVVESASADGMEADGLFFMATHFYDTYDGTTENYLTTLSVHETSHEWWYGLVGNDQALEPWLDEALATYSERTFYAANYPDELTWWWTFRIRRFDPLGAANGDIYANGSFRTYTNATYFMGAYFLDDLRVRIGDKAFYAALSDYAQVNSYRIAGAADFFAAINRHSSVDYADLVKEYFK